MKVSVIVTTYNQNHDNLIEHCLDSVIDERAEDVEYILVDDCSSDGSFEVLKQYEKKFPSCVRAIQNVKNGGEGGSRNFGIKNSSSDYICYIDGDDFVSEGFFYELKKTLDKAGDVDLVGPRYAKTTFEGELLNYATSELMEDTPAISDDTKRKMLLHGERSVGRFYKRSIIEDNDLWFIENVPFADTPSTSYWTNLCNSYAHCEDAVYYYRKTPNSLSTSKLTTKKTDAHYETQKFFINNGKRLGLYEKYQNELDYRLFRRDFNYKLKECVLSFNDSERDEYYTKVCKLFLENTTDLVNNPYIDKADKKKLNEFLENPVKFGKKQSRAINFKFEFLGNLAKIKHFIIRK